MDVVSKGSKDEAVANVIFEIMEQVFQPVWYLAQESFHLHVHSACDHLQNVFSFAVPSQLINNFGLLQKRILSWL